MGTQMNIDDRANDILKQRLIDVNHHSIPTLNDLTEEMVDEVRLLARVSKVLLVRYIRYIVKRPTFGEIEDFERDVLQGHADVKSWGIRDVLCIPRIDDTAAASYRVSDLIAALGEMKGERWWRVKPVRWDYWDYRSIPGVLVRAVPYWWYETLPRNLDSHAEIEPFEFIHEGLIVSAFRRWIASRVAWRARQYLERGTPSMEGILLAIKLTHGDLSEDGRVAIEALLRESALGNGDMFSLAPGFRGPDEWYGK
jgi:hypothetical protein